MDSAHQTVAVAANRLGINARTLRRYCEQGRVPEVILVQSEKQTSYAVPTTVTVDDIDTPEMGRPRKDNDYENL